MNQGIFQIGIGSENIQASSNFYSKAFNMNTCLLDTKGEAEKMRYYTGGKIQERHAQLLMNPKGGGGIETWEFISKTPEKMVQHPILGNYGIFLAKIACHSVDKKYAYFKKLTNVNLSGIQRDELGRKMFYLKDPFGNFFQIIEMPKIKNQKVPEGIMGCTIGVSDMDRSLDFYAGLLGFKDKFLDKTGQFKDFHSFLPGGGATFRRVILSKHNEGFFGGHIGDQEIELVELQDYKAEKIFNNCCWGYVGFIHLCLLDSQIDKFSKELIRFRTKIRVDSGDQFKLGKTLLRFCYFEDPDGTLIELVEPQKWQTGKLNINLKKFGLKHHSSSLLKYLFKLAKWI